MLVNNWQDAWKWFSMQAHAFVLTANTVGAALYAAGRLPDKYVTLFLIVNALAAGAGGAGRIVKQESKP